MTACCVPHSTVVKLSSPSDTCNDGVEDDFDDDFDDDVGDDAGDDVGDDVGNDVVVVVIVGGSDCFPLLGWAESWDCDELGESFDRDMILFGGVVTLGRAGRTVRNANGCTQLDWGRICVDVENATGYLILTAGREGKDSIKPAWIFLSGECHGNQHRLGNRGVLRCEVEN